MFAQSVPACYNFYIRRFSYSKRQLMKNLIYTMCILLLFAGCTKGINSVSEKAINSSSGESAQKQLIKYGAQVEASDIQSKIGVMNDLGVSYNRYTITIAEWKGADKGYQKFIDNGFHVVCNINNAVQSSSQKPVPFLKDTVTYKKKLAQILNKYQPEVVVIENEEDNHYYYSGPMTDYINEIAAASRIVHAKGLKVANGGLHPKDICYFVWKDYNDRGLTAKADDWMNLTFNSTMKYAATHPQKVDNNLNYHWRQVDTLLNAYTSLNIDYINIHIYEPINDVGNGDSTIPGCIATMADYLRRRTGKSVMSNECGQHNTSTTIVPSMLQAFADGNYAYSLWFSCDGNKAYALNNSDGSLRPNGVSYKNYVSQYR